MGGILLFLIFFEEFCDFIKELKEKRNRHNKIYPKSGLPGVNKEKSERSVNEKF
jgi:hypothetical protein